MTTIHRRLLSALTLLSLLMLTPAPAQDADGKLVRIQRNRDGSTSEFERNPENTVLEKRTYIEKANGEKIIRSRTVFRRNSLGKLVSGAIYDGQGKKLFRVVYGYNRYTGRLVAENMYDARTKRTDPIDPSKELAVRATRYTYDAQGRRGKPQIFTSQAGKTAEQLLAWLEENKPTDGIIDQDPYRTAPVNPNARRVGQ